MKKILSVLITFLVLATVVGPVQAFNLWADIQQNTQWTLGSSVAAGTAMALRSDDSTGLRAGQFIGSALAQVSNYRFLSLWGGGNFIPQNNGNEVKAIETVKIGFNAAYLFKGFANQPPAVIKNLVFGPSVSTSIWTTPRVMIPFVDLNYAFSGTSGAPGTLGAPTVPVTSRLNLFYGGQAG